MERIGLWRKMRFGRDEKGVSAFVVVLLVFVLAAEKLKGLLCCLRRKSYAY